MLKHIASGPGYDLRHGAVPVGIDLDDHRPIWSNGDIPAKTVDRAEHSVCMVDQRARLFKEGNDESFEDHICIRMCCKAPVVALS